MLNEVQHWEHPGRARGLDFAKDSRMDKIVILPTERPAPRRSLNELHSGARILFFTGVRYCRDTTDVPPGICPEQRSAQDAALLAGPGLALDLAAH